MVSQLKNLFCGYKILYYLCDMGFDLTFGLGSAIGSALGFASQERTNKANMKLAKYQYEKNLEMWNRENEYNTPANQRKRLEAAGLNPALMYGNGSVANTAGSAPQYDAPKLSAYTDFSDMGVGLGIQAMMAGKQARNIDADTDKKEQETSNLAATQRLTSIDAELRSLQVIGQGIANAKSDFERQTMKQLYDLQLRQTEATIGRDTAAAALAGSQSGYYDAQSKTEDALRPQRVVNERKRGKVLDTEAERNRKQGNAADAAAEASRAAAAVSRSTEKKIISETNILNYRVKERLDSELEGLQYEVLSKGVKLTREQIQMRLDKFMQDEGLDPRSTGVSGLVDKLGYQLYIRFNQLFNVLGIE